MIQSNSTRVVCPQCGYDDNPATATHCLNCNSRLRTQSLDPGDRDLPPRRGGIPWSVIPLAGLLLVTLGLFFLWRQNQPPTPPSLQPLASQANPPQDWQLYNSLQDVPNVPEGVFLYGGAMASAALRSKNIQSEITRAHPNFRLLYTDPLNVPPDSGKGIEMSANGEISFSESFRPIQESEYNIVRSRGYTLKQVPVALGGIAFYSHPGLKLPGISLGQIQEIYSGKITNWRQLGGPNLPIVPVSQDPDAKASTSFLLQGMPSSQRRFGKNVQVVRDTTAAIRRVAAIPGGFGYGAQALVVGQETIQPLALAKGRSRNYIPAATPDGTANKQALLDGSYPLIRRIFVVYREDGSLDEIAGRAYANLLLSVEGQKLVDRAGYLPIRGVESQ